jgi:hypothetical protein
MSPIPWAAILTHGPTIVSSVRHLLATTNANRSRDRDRTVEARLDQLEKGSMDSARLLHDLAQQVQVLATAQEQTARRARIAIVVSVVAVVVATGASILAVVW